MIRMRLMFVFDRILPKNIQYLLQIKPWMNMKKNVSGTFVDMHFPSVFVPVLHALVDAIKLNTNIKIKLYFWRFHQSSDDFLTFPAVECCQQWPLLKKIKILTLQEVLELEKFYQWYTWHRDFSDARIYLFIQLRNANK